ncbi:outer membrane protein assembly factor BamA [Pacificimonas flava]|uniref:Outer membrane protein assembly factor BamA n=1 Tax=Pacificimonas flava TaxID=1234595 RepID=M2U9B4_9SPHN|nr:outer membrane protein assembly factor BamA [Pacificimonas flava]EMD84562.1 Outer membrane protein assembly factor YaeT precursor [Pacificimonas flava]MBB5279568.1 outer membrane protein insertion porin family [Pacificimonas flava]
MINGFAETRSRAVSILLMGAAPFALSVPAYAQDAGTAGTAFEESAPDPNPAQPQPPVSPDAGASGDLVVPGTVGSTASAPISEPAPVSAPINSPAPATNAADIATPAANAQETRTVRSITIRGSERIEPETVASYTGLSAGDTYDRNRLDQALKALFDTSLFADATITDRNGDLVINVRENPVVNRIILEDNRRLKDDKIAPEIRLAPRQIFTRAKARSDVARITELYRRQGRFSASVEPLIVPLDQNRVDVVFKITEGPKSKVRSINIIGNEKFSDGELRGEMATKEAKWYRIFTSNDTYDPDRSAYDQQVLRQFYLTEGYADFRVVSSVAELTPNNEDFVITYVVDEGERYDFGEVGLESEIRDIDEKAFQSLLGIRSGDPYNAKLIEDAIDRMQETAGLLGYAFADVQPQFTRNREDLTMDVVFVIREAPRVYVERIDINGNVITKDRVVRREFRLVEGDAFNSFLVKRSEARIRSLGFFQEDLAIEQKQGSGPDKVILEVNAQEQATGELQLSAGFSSLERFLVSGSIRQKNFRGLGQELRASVNYSSYSKSVQLGFTEPYLFDRNLALGVDLFRRDLNSFNFRNSDRQSTYEQSTTGGQVRTGFPITEFWSASLRYNLQVDDITLDRGVYFSDFDGSGSLDDDECDPLRAGRFLCDALGNRLTSSIGFSVAFDNTDNRIRPTRGQRVVLSQDVAGLGGIKYLRTTVDADKYWRVGRSNFIFNLGIEGGFIAGYGGDDIRINDRFFLGEPRMRGFDIRGLGPRVIRRYYQEATEDTPGAIPVPNLNGEPGFVVLQDDSRRRQDDALGGEAYYLGRAELQVPISQGLSEMGIRPSLFVDVGALWDVDFDPSTQLINQPVIERTFIDEDGNEVVVGSPGVEERFFGDSPSPRVSVGIGTSWNSPFGPFRFDLAKAIVKQEGDDTQLFQFNVGTTF